MRFEMAKHSEAKFERDKFPIANQILSSLLSAYIASCNLISPLPAVQCGADFLHPTVQLGDHKATQRMSMAECPSPMINFKGDGL